MKFTKLQKIVIWVLAFGVLFFGIGVSEFVLDALDVRFTNGSRFTFGFIGLLLAAGALVLHVFVNAKDEENPR